jgi:hypothetical protein
VLDEPTTGLDLIARHAFMERVREIARQGTTLIRITSKRSSLKSVASSSWAVAALLPPGPRSRCSPASLSAACSMAVWRSTRSGATTTRGPADSGGLAYAHRPESLRPEL